ncbi:MAG: VapE domain-containing protein [Thiomonas sp.]
MAARIDFAQLAAALLSAAERLVPAWLPEGQREGHEWRCGGLSGRAGSSMAVNLHTGIWADFATEDKGGDLIALYAAIHGLTQIEAARQLADDMHMTPAAAPTPTAQTADPAPVPPRKSEWEAIVPVPDLAGKPPTSHFRFGQASRTWAYQWDGELFGYVQRFDRVDSKGKAVKEVLPLTFCRNAGDGSMKWHYKQWDAPRPLYLPSGFLNPGRVVVVVEGEKCADALHAMLGEEFDVVSWPGGGKAVQYADWSWIKGRKVLLWPDTDSKRLPLPKSAPPDTDPASMPYKPLDKQPGVTAMVAAGRQLLALDCDVYMLPVAEPGVLPDGYDVADMIEEGGTAEAVRVRLREARRDVLYQFAPDLQPAGVSTPAPAGAEPNDDPHAWKLSLLRTDKGAIKAVRENVVLALESLPDVQGTIVFNRFSNNVEKRTPVPWNTGEGRWKEADELLMGEWLVRTHRLPSCSRTTLEEAVAMAATRHEYHPVREYLASLKWDGVERLPIWLARACCADPSKLTAETAHYYGLVGMFFLMGMAQRALVPGCKFDYMPILEGRQGLRKSTLVRTLGGAWCADTNIQIGDKDSYQNLQGVWIYELSELDSMAKAEITRVKAFVASTIDRFRASFDKRPNDYPRQVVFMGTTNEQQYLIDPTGNRRFWPVHVTRQIDITWVEQNRNQLFAEAVVRLQRGERYYPTPEEEAHLFEPQQGERMVDSPVEAAILRYLTQDANGMLLKEVQVTTLLGSIGVDLSKLGPGRHFEKQAGAALKKFGWERKRSSAPGRPWVYRRPEGWPACMHVDAPAETVDDMQDADQFDEVPF